jgi:hypothetical protein
MIDAQVAVRTAREYLGENGTIRTPYAQMDCIGFIRELVHKCPGGQPGWRCAGTNSLWRSHDQTGKYRDLTWRQEGLEGARAGMLAFIREGSDVSHVGLCTGEGTVIHSSKSRGGVVETPLSSRNLWSALGILRHIGAAQEGTQGNLSAEGGGQMTQGGEAEVTTREGRLRIRQSPVSGKVIGYAEKGERVQILEEGDWPRIACGGVTGYVSGAYLTRLHPAPGEKEPEQEDTRPETEIPVTILDDAGNVFRPRGHFRVFVGAVD